MSQKNNPAAKAARRFERESTKQKQSVSERSVQSQNQMELEFIKKNAAEKRSFGDFTQEQLLKMPVRITFISEMLLRDDAILEFETDTDRFLNTLLFCKSKLSHDPQYSNKYYSILMELFKSGAPFDEYMFTIAMHYLASIPCVEHKLRYGLQPLSFRVFMNGDADHIDTLVQISSLEDWLNIRDLSFETILNNKNNKNAA